MNLSHELVTCTRVEPTAHAVVQLHASYDGNTYLLHVRVTRTKSRYAVIIRKHILEVSYTASLEQQFIGINVPHCWRMAVQVAEYIGASSAADVKRSETCGNVHLVPICAGLNHWYVCFLSPLTCG